MKIGLSINSSCFFRDIYVSSFGGLFMLLRGDLLIAAKFELAHRLFILIRKVNTFFDVFLELFLMMGAFSSFSQKRPTFLVRTKLIYIILKFCYLIIIYFSKIHFSNYFLILFCF